MKKSIFRLLFLSVSICIIILSGCVGSPEPVDDTKNTTNSAPDWFFNPPDEDEKYKYFIGSGSSETDDIAEAEDNARRTNKVARMRMLFFIRISEVF